MSGLKHTPGPWLNREGTILADSREQTCCGQPCVGGEYMGQKEMVCCGVPDVDGCEDDEIATVRYERDIPLVIAAPDMLSALRKAVLALAHVCESDADDAKLYGDAYRTVSDAIAKATGAV